MDACQELMWQMLPHLSWTGLQVEANIFADIFYVMEVKYSLLLLDSFIG